MLLISLLSYCRRLALVWMALLLFAGCQPPDTGHEMTALPSSTDRLAHWQQLGYGMFIHWGLYSELGGMWQGQPVREGYSEQIQGWAGISADDYAAVAARFHADQFDADTICQLARDAGARYIVVTSKHHDGFAMFETDSTDYNIVQRTPFARDYPPPAPTSGSDSGSISRWWIGMPGMRLKCSIIPTPSRLKWSR